MKISNVSANPNAGIRSFGVKLVLALMLAGAPIMTLSLAAFNSAPATLAGPSYPDDVDPG
ncbi:MAG: hypothetical protein WD273_07245 [Trueperaceae bacterium]